MDIPNFNPQLVQLTKPERGAHIVRIGRTKNWQYRFKNPLMQNYVLMKGIASGMVNPEELTTILPIGPTQMAWVDVS